MQTLQQAFIDQAQTTPYLCAVKDTDHHQYTYQRLHELSDHLANYLIDVCHIPPRSNVAIFTDKSADYVAICLAILKAGCAFIPLETALPKSLIAQVIEEADPKLIFTDNDHLQQLPHHIDTFVLDNAWAQALPQATVLPSERITYDVEDTACLVYSSGTTGRPKGIDMPHRAIMSSYWWRYSIVDYHPNERVACNIFFIWEVFRPLLRGATSYVIKDHVLHDLPQLLETLHYHHIDEILLTPSFLETLIYCTDSETLQHYFAPTRCWLNGEPVSHQFRRQMIEALPHVHFYNLYSISECHDVAALELTSQYFKYDNTSQYCSVGTVMPDANFLIVDQNNKPVPEGHSGELLIAGPGVAKGYLNQPELTAQRFKPAEKNKMGKALYRTGDLARLDRYGQLEILGRCDFMVKIRGYSVQLKAVETTIKHLDSVQNCIVSTIGQEGNKHLIAYILPVSGKHQTIHAMIDSHTATSIELSQLLKEYMPYYMIPSYYMVVQELPIDSKLGTVNYEALPLPQSLTAASTYQSNDQLEQLWQKHLGITIDQYTADKDLFQLGGHSLTAIQLVNDLDKEMGLTLTINELLENPSLNAVRRLLTSQDQQSDNPTANYDWRQESQLSSTIQINSTATDKPLSQSQGILLTGATGFLGPYIAYELIKHTQCPIYCLVRAEDHQQGMTRLHNNLMAHHQWHDDMLDRLKPITGDLTQTNLGLTNSDWTTLIDNIDHIFHCGASVNLLYPYPSLKPTVVHGTHEIIKLAARSGASLHYVSSNGIFPNQAQTFPENDQIDDYPSWLRNGYSQSKWVAEKIVWRAHRAGLHVTVYRPGNLGVATNNGYLNPNDFNGLMLRAMLATGQLPADFALEMTPVNWLAHNLVQISRHQDQSGYAYNMTQPSLIPAHKLIELTHDINDNIQTCSYNTWHQSLVEFDQLAHLLEAFGNELLTPKGQLVQSRFQQMQQQLNLTHEINTNVIKHCLHVCYNTQQEVL